MIAELVSDGDIDSRPDLLFKDKDSTAQIMAITFMMMAPFYRTFIAIYTLILVTVCAATDEVIIRVDPLGKLQQTITNLAPDSVLSFSLSSTTFTKTESCKM